MTERKYQSDPAQPAMPQEDPLVELARIVSEGDAYNQSAHHNAPQEPASDHLTAELEAELFDEVRAAYDARAAHEQQAYQPENADPYQGQQQYDPYALGNQPVQPQDPYQGYEQEQPVYQEPAPQPYYDPGQMVPQEQGYQPAPTYPQVDPQQHYAQEPAYAPEVAPQQPVYVEPQSPAYETAPAYAPVDLDSVAPGVSADHRYEPYDVGQRSNGELPLDEQAGVLPPHSDDALNAAPSSSGGGKKALYAAGAVIGALLIGGVGVFAYRGAGDTAAPPPIIRADTNPAKVVPDDPGGKEIPHQNKAIYDRVGGDDPVNGDGKLVSSEEKPLDLTKNTGTQGKVTRVIDLSGNQNGTTSSTSERIGPKKVRTVIVKPDGTIVGGAPAAPKPVTTQQVAAVDPVTPPAPEIDNTTAAANELLGQINDQGEVEAVAGTPSNVPVPLARPTPPAPVVTASADTNPVILTPEPEAPATPVVDTPAAPSGLTSGYVVQVSSQRSESQARVAFTNLQRRYPTLLGAQSVHIQSADLGGRGIYYRAGVGPMATRAEAAQFCTDLKAAGGECLVRRVP